MPCAPATMALAGPRHAGPARGLGTIEMIAHCIFHQTPPRERARCDECGGELSPINEIWYCGQCLRERAVEDCPICDGRPWN
jgi:ribosomal protein S14